MERADKVGFGVATAGHLLLFAILSLGLVSTARLPPPHTEPIDVQLVDLIGMRSAAPKAAPEPPARSEAPDEAPPEDAAPPPADAVPPLPVPKPAAPPPAAAKPAPEKPAAKPEPKPEPKPVPKPEPKPTPPKPKPEPKPEPKPLPPKPQKNVRAEKAAADKAAAEKAAAADKAAAKVAADKAAAQKAAAAKAKAAKDRDAAVKAAVEQAAAQEAKGNGAKGSKAKAAGSRLGPDFLKGLKAEKATGKAAAPAAAVVDARAMAGLAAAIKRQVEPCYELGSLQGTDAMQIVTTLRLRFNKDGSTATAPTITGQTGVDADNRAYARQIGEVAKRAVLRCSPLRLPAELYEGGWEDLELVFTPGQMR